MHVRGNNLIIILRLVSAIGKQKKKTLARGACSKGWEGNDIAYFPLVIGKKKREKKTSDDRGM